MGAHISEINGAIGRGADYDRADVLLLQVKSETGLLATGTVDIEYMVSKIGRCILGTLEEEEFSIPSGIKLTNTLRKSL